MKLKDIWYRPILLEQLKGYNKETFFKDLVAGLIVGVVALPLAIAFGIASGVTPEKGIISCIVAGVLCALFGGSKFQITGPTGALIVIVSGVISSHGVEGLFVATFISGIVLLIMGICRIGDIIKLIPYPIVIGFTSGVAVTIFTTQVKDLLGLDITIMPVGFIPRWSAYIEAISTFNPYALATVVVTIIIVKICQKISHKIPAYLVAIIITSAISYTIREVWGLELMKTIGDKFVINSSLPRAQSLDLSLSNLQQLMTAGFTIAIFGSIVTLLSATVADGVKSESHNPNTELIGQGVANMIVPFMGGIPVTGAIARTLTNIENGGRTQIVNIIHAIVLLIILLFLSSLSAHIPMATLAAILTLISYNMFNFRTFAALLKMPFAGVMVLLVTFLLTVIFDLTVAIQVGLLLAVGSFIRRTTSTTSISKVEDIIHTSHDAEVKQKESIKIPQHVEVFEIEGPFFFGVANKFEEVSSHIRKEIPQVRIIRMRRVPFIDSTGIHNLETLYHRSFREGTVLVLSGVTEDVKSSIDKFGLGNIVGQENICANIHVAIARANQILESNNQAASTTAHQ